ncbi:unnamed protein product, partial [Phaeothamnion confervicola]
LIHTPDVVDRFLGSIAPMSQPMWLGSEPLVSLKLESAEIVWPDGRPHSVAERMTHQPPVLEPYASSGRLVRFERRQFRVLDGGRATGEKT